MAQVYKFKVKLAELEETMWREVEITSVSSIAKLGYAILAAFEATASHLFCIKHNQIRYEFLLDDDFDDEVVMNPAEIKLSALKLSVGDHISMEYDYGAGWEFLIELISIHDMKKGSGTHYPYITDGKGRGIIEDTCPGILIEYINQIDKSGIYPTYFDYEINEEREWNYNKFDLEYVNAVLKLKIEDIKNAYENE